MTSAKISGETLDPMLNIKDKIQRTKQHFYVVKPHKKKHPRRIVLNLINQEKVD